MENGQEVRPHHYIRSILPEGPVGQNGTLRSGDELLEVIEFPYLFLTKLYRAFSFQSARQSVLSLVLELRV